MRADPHTRTQPGRPTRTFVDAGVLVAAYDHDHPHREPARRLLTDLWRTRTGTTSTAVLHEVSIALGKATSPRLARKLIAPYDAWRPYQPDTSDLLAAADLEADEPGAITPHAALVLVAAQRAGARLVVSDRIERGRHRSGVAVMSPF